MSELLSPPPPDESGGKTPESSGEKPFQPLDQDEGTELILMEAYISDSFEQSRGPWGYMELEWDENTINKFALLRARRLYSSLIIFLHT